MRAWTFSLFVSLSLCLESQARWSAGCSVGYFSSDGYEHVGLWFALRPGRKERPKGPPTLVACYSTTTSFRTCRGWGFPRLDCLTAEPSSLGTPCSGFGRFGERRWPSGVEGTSRIANPHFRFSYPTTTTRHRRIPEECGSLLRQRPNTKSWSAIIQRTELTKRTSSSKQIFQVSNQNAHFSEPYNSGTAGQ